MMRLERHHHVRERTTRLHQYVAILASLLVIIPTVASSTQDATAAGEWISVGVPVQVNVSSLGSFYLLGDDHGRCASTRPSYFRSDMDKAHWKELYALFLSAEAQRKPLTCIVDSGCGSDEVWVSYCAVVS